MPARILDGKALAQQIRVEVAAGVAALKAQADLVPGLAVVLVGDDPASAVYVRSKQKASQEAGMRGEIVRYPSSLTEAELLATIDRLNSDPAVHGILVQLPLPAHVEERKVLERVSPAKDVDGFHPENVGLLAIGHPRFVPCTPLGIREMLVRSGVAVSGSHAVIIGRSNLVGKPLAMLLWAKGSGGNATVTVCHTGTRDVAAHARQADVLVAAMGRPEEVRADWVKPGAVVIDVGIHKRADGSLCGDVHFPSVREVAGLITPVPGGVGPMTVAMLLQNTLQAARLALS